MNAQDIIRKLGLKPHPKEGGYFIETYRANEFLDGLDARYLKPRRELATAIYYLLTPDTCSRMHRLKSDEIFHFYLGDPVSMLWLLPDGSSQIKALGSDIFHGEEPQVVVPKGFWQGCYIARPRHGFVLLGTTVTPAFDYSDYEEGLRQDLVAAYPSRKDLITRLTP